MLTTGCVISCGYFSNMDGLLGIRTPKGNFKTQRLLYTDSGHYLLPIHYFNSPSDEKLNNIMKHEHKTLQHSHRKPRTKHIDNVHKKS